MSLKGDEHYQNSGKGGQAGILDVEMYSQYQVSLSEPDYVAWVDNTAGGLLSGRHQASLFSTNNANCGGGVGVGHGRRIK